MAQKLHELSSYFMRIGRTMRIVHVAIFEGLLSEFREVNGIFYFPELVLGSKSTFTSRIFRFSVHVAIWW